jgi:hypothetical protein
VYLLLQQKWTWLGQTGENICICPQPLPPHIHALKHLSQGAPRVLAWLIHRCPPHRLANHGSAGMNLLGVIFCFRKGSYF